MRFPPLRYGIPLFLLLTGMSIVAGLTLYAMARAEANVEQDLTERARMMGTLVAMEVEGDLRQHDLSRARDLVMHLSADPELIDAHLVGDGRQVLFSTDIRSEGRVVSEASVGVDPSMLEEARSTQQAVTEIDSELQRLTAVFPLALHDDDGGIIPTGQGALVIRYDLTPALGRAHSEALFDAAVLAIGVLFVTLVSYAIFRFTLLRRLRKLITASGRLARGEHAARSAVSGGDEIAWVSKAFDRMADELESRTRALRENEAKLRSLFESMTDAVLVVDDAHRVRFANPASEWVVGSPGQELVGARLEDLVVPAHRAAVRATLSRMLSADTPQKEMLELDIEPPSAEDPRPIEALFVRPADPESVGGLLVHARDVTERHELEEQLRRSQKLEPVGRLAGAVAHDFNNLLAVVVANTDMASRDPTMSFEARQLLDDVRVAARRGADLTKQLLAFGRRDTVEPVALSPNALVEEVEGLLRRLLPANVATKLVLEPELPALVADRTHMTQMLMNLAVNARDAMPEGGELVFATTSHREADGRQMVEIRVTDTGTGIDPEDQDRIFEPFFTTKGPTRGTGLGLSIVYSIVRRAGGTLSVESEPGRGTTFHLRFPAVDASEIDPEDSGIRSERPRGGGEPVLLVEDEAPVRKMLERVLERAGYRVTSCDSAEAALASLASDTAPVFRVVISDYQLPGMDGLRFLKHVAAEHPAMERMLITGFAGGAEAAARAESITVLHKPFTPAELLTALRERLEARSVGQDAGRA